MNFSWLTLDQLKGRRAAALIAAHDAPMNPYRLNADGHKWVEQQSTAWSKSANEWMDLCEEIDRREKELVR